MKTLFITLLLFTAAVSAKCLPEVPEIFNKICWIAPTELNNDEPITLADLGDFKIQVRDSESLPWRDFVGGTVSNTSTGTFWMMTNGKSKPSCQNIQIRAVSIYNSELTSKWVDGCYIKPPVIRQ